MTRESVPIRTAAAASAYTAIILGLGYWAFGLWTMLIFTSGFVGGLVLWLIFPGRVRFDAIKWPYWCAMALFAVHRVEEYASNFFDTLAGLTGVSKPEALSWPIAALVILSVGGWLAVPALLQRGVSFGSYLAWTFFAAMGITELAHILVFPLIVSRPFAYFPGMASVFVLAPVAWWGMWRCVRPSHTAVGARKS